MVEYRQFGGNLRLRMSLALASSRRRSETGLDEVGMKREIEAFLRLLDFRRFSGTVILVRFPPALSLARNLIDKWGCAYEGRARPWVQLPPVPLGGPIGMGYLSLGHPMSLTCLPTI